MIDEFVKVILVLIAKVNSHILPEYVKVMGRIDDVIAALAEKETNVSRKEISGLIGFDPWKYRYIEVRRIERALKLIEDIKAKKKQKPGVSLSNTYKGLVGKSAEIEEKTVILETKAYPYFKQLLEEKFWEAMDSYDFESADYFGELKRGLE